MLHAITTAHSQFHSFQQQTVVQQLHHCTSGDKDNGRFWKYTCCLLYSTHAKHAVLGTTRVSYDAVIIVMIVKEALELYRVQSTAMGIHPNKLFEKKKEKKLQLHTINTVCCTTTVVLSVVVPQ